MALVKVSALIAVCFYYVQAEDELIKCYQCRRSSDWMCNKKPFEGEKVATCPGLSCLKTYNEEGTLIERNCQPIKCSDKKYSTKENVASGEGPTQRKICCESNLCNSSGSVTPSFILPVVFSSMLLFTGFTCSAL